MTNGRATIHGRVWDSSSGRPLEARVSVIASTGQFCSPREAILTGPPATTSTGLPIVGVPSFACDGAFVVEAPSGPAEIIVERGTEYARLVLSVRVPSDGGLNVDLPLQRWINMPERGWYAGNTHVHYPATETAAEERLSLDPRVEDLPVLIVSVLQRRDDRPASNAFPIGIHPRSSRDHVIDIGEEVRHNAEQWQIGLGHIMLINLRTPILPLSRGLLVDDSSPDFPPLVDACDSARSDGAVVIWCHNGLGMEAPVAAILGRVDALNIFDPCWMDPEYAIWYRLLDCGVRLPISTGSDWYICSSNRVYTEVGSDFNYEGWLAALKAGRTFATNGPILQLSVDGRGPSNEPIEPGRRKRADVTIAWTADIPIDAVELVADGEVVAGTENLEGALHGSWSGRVDVSGVGWIAARAQGGRRARYGQATWSHTSPVYLRGRPVPSAAARAAAAFCDDLDLSQKWLTTRARFDNDRQRDRMTQLFGDAREAFLRLK